MSTDWGGLVSSVAPAVINGVASGAFTGGVSTGASDAISKQYAAINADDFNFYKDNYRPVESKLLGMSSGLDTGNVLANGQSYFSNLASSQNGMTKRVNDRYGATQYGQTTATNKLQNSLNNVAQRTNFTNTTRDTLENKNLGLTQEMIGLGRKLNTNALSAMGGAANAATNASNAANQMNANNFNTAMQGLGSGVMNFMSKPQQYDAQTNNSLSSYNATTPDPWATESNWSNG